MFANINCSVGWTCVDQMRLSGLWRHFRNKKSLQLGGVALSFDREHLLPLEWSHCRVFQWHSFEGKLLFKFMSVI